MGADLQISGPAGPGEIRLREKKPLAENTMNRIARGLEKFVFSCPEPFIMKYYNGGYTGAGTSIRDPLHTITTVGRHALVTPYIMQTSHTGFAKDRNQSVEDGTVSALAVDWKELLEAGIDGETAQKCTWVSQFIMEYYGRSVGQDLKEPLHTVVGRDRFALLTVLGSECVILDIFLRMLTPEELKLGQGFPRDYVTDRDYNGNRYPASKQVARIGNSVVPVMAQKLVEANCGYLKVGERQPIWQIRNSVTEDDGQMRFA